MAQEGLSATYWKARRTAHRWHALVFFLGSCKSWFLNLISPWRACGPIASLKTEDPGAQRGHTASSQQSWSWMPALPCPASALLLCCPSGALLGLGVSLCAASSVPTWPREYNEQRVWHAANKAPCWLGDCCEELFSGAWHQQHVFFCREITETETREEHDPCPENFSLRKIYFAIGYETAVNVYSTT